MWTIKYLISQFDSRVTEVNTINSLITTGQLGSRGKNDKLLDHSGNRVTEVGTMIIICSILSKFIDPS